MRRKILAYFLHMLAALFFLGLPFVFFYEDPKFDLTRVLVIPYYWLCAISFWLLFYGNYYYLIPRFYLKKKYGQYFLVMLLLFVGFYLMKPFILLFSHYLQARNMGKMTYAVLKPDPMSCILFVIVVSLGMVMHVVREWRATEKRALKAETEKATAELSFLKAQINPHFLFNTLNNIYSLSVDQHPDTSASIMQLSNIMRYITDEATKDLVPLKDEIACLTDFISLHRLRHGTNVKVDFSVTGNVEEKEVAPMLFMTYIENVFKYGISSNEEAPITIRIAAEPDHIRFFCQNRIFARPRVTERTGVGLVNTEQRLKHHYPNRHELKITNADDFYTVELTLDT